MPDEAQARAEIDRLLTEAGWSLQDYKHYNPGAGHSIALREVPLQSGRCDYLLLVDRAAVGSIKATRLSSVESVRVLCGQFASFSAGRKTSSVSVARSREIERR